MKTKVDLPFLLRRKKFSPFTPTSTSALNFSKKKNNHTSFTSALGAIP